MGLSINKNTSALIGLRQSAKANEALKKSLEQIATGRRINTAADDSSSMTIADRLKSRSLAAGQEMENANISLAMAQIAEGALGQANDVLQNIRTKTVAAASGLHSADSLAAIQSDINGSLGALKDLAGTTAYNGQNLLDGSFSTESLSIGSVDPSMLGSDESGRLAGINVTTADGAQAALGVVDQALDQVSRIRSDVGSSQNQYTSQVNTLSTSQLNLMSAESQIRDTDMAEASIMLNKAGLQRRAAIYAMNQAARSSTHLVDLIG